MSRQILCLCKPGFESILSREFEGAFLDPSKIDSGAVLVLAKESTSLETLNLCFATCILDNVQLIDNESINKQATAITESFLRWVKDEKIDKPWPMIFLSVDEKEGLKERAKSVRTTVLEKLRKVMARVSKLATEEVSSPFILQKGLFVFFADFNKIYVSSHALFNGQQRMKMDELAPSRSYLKIEEAYHMMGYAPKESELVVDLGAAPGGWSYSALKRGARVIAVDNGALKGSFTKNPNLQWLREDAFIFRPDHLNEKVDWLLCDMVEDPYRILELVTKWWNNGWCRKFIVNLKIGRADAIVLFKEIKKTKLPVKVRQLYHDRDEITVCSL